MFSEDEIAFLTAVATLIIVAVERDRQRAGDPPRRAARSAHRPAEPHARARPARPCAGPPAARAHRRGGVRPRRRRLQADQRLARSCRRRRGAARARARGWPPRCAPPTRSRAWAATSSSSSAPTSTAHAAPRDVAERLAAAVTRPLRPRERRALLHGQHGRHAGRDDKDTPESLLGDADAAMYRAKAARPRPLRAVRRGDAHEPDGPRAHRDRAAPRARPRRARGLLPAGDRPRHRPAGVDRGARALAAPRARPGRPARVHPDRRGDRPDRRARAAGPRGRLPPDRGLAARHRPGDRRVGQRLRAPGAQPAVPRPGGGDRRAQRAARPARWRSRSPRPC